MQLSEHFSLEEACFSSTAQRLLLENKPVEETIGSMRQAALGLEKVRHLLGEHPLHIDSWYRCPALNRAIGGAAFSAHMMGWAIDFTCTIAGLPFQLVNRLSAFPDLIFDQLIQEGTWVHVSFAPTARRQILTAHFGPSGTTYS